MIISRKPMYDLCETIKENWPNTYKKMMKTSGSEPVEKAYITLYREMRYFLNSFSCMIREEMVRETKDSDNEMYGKIYIQWMIFLTSAECRKAVEAIRRANTENSSEDCSIICERIETERQVFNDLFSIEDLKNALRDCSIIITRAEVLMPQDPAFSKMNRETMAITDH